MAQPYSSHWHPVLGTELHLLVGCKSSGLAEQVELRVLDEIARLESLLSTYRDETPLSRWIRGEFGGELPAEVVTLLALASDWFVASGGALHPGLGEVGRRWREAELTGLLPDRGECRRLAEQADRLPFEISASEQGQRVERSGDCSGLDLDALAKGWIIDRAAEAGLLPGVDWVLVNVGGDMRLAGSGLVRVAIENPRSDVDNAPAMAVVSLSPGGLASSGSARRGFLVGDHWFGHVLDPRTGWPVEVTAGVTVIAGDAVTADALATVVGVRGLDSVVVTGLLAGYQAAAMVVSAAGDLRFSDRWREQVDFEVG